jgi:hypothetical protein
MGVDCFACHLHEWVLKPTLEGKDGLSCEQSRSPQKGTYAGHCWLEEKLLHVSARPRGRADHRIGSKRLTRACRCCADGGPTARLHSDGSACTADGHRLHA